MRPFYYDDDFIKAQIIRDGDLVDKVIICGPPKFMEDITHLCAVNGYPSSKVHYI
jgi:ferredoxin-NADP reductase